MRSKVVGGVVFLCLFATSVFGDPNTQIRYQTTDLGSGRWQYTYDVCNISLTPVIEEFTIWFDYDSFDSLTIETPDPPAGGWDELAIQPEPVLQDDGYYDALALSAGIGEGETVSGFAVSFGWLGVGEPGSQFYEIIDPIDFHTIESGYTVPEPATLLVFGLGGMILRKRTGRKDAKIN